MFMPARGSTCRKTHLVVVLFAFAGLVAGKLYAAFSVQDTPSSSLKKKSQKVVNRELPVDGGINDTRPFFIFHIGPPKTGTSSIQTFLRQKKDLFPLDNYKAFYDGPAVQGIKACLSQKPNPNDSPCYQPYLDEFVRQEANIVMSDENFIGHIGTEKWNEFYGALQQHFQLKVVLYYRRHFDRLVSLRKESFRARPSTGFREIPTIVSFYETSLRDRRGWSLSSSPTLFVEIARDLERQKRDNATQIVVHNFHVQDVVEDFYCDVVPNAPHVYGVFPAKRPRENPGYAWIDYDSIAYEARKRGILPQTVTRKQAMEYVKHYQEEILNKTVNDLPETCLSPAQLEQLRQASYDAEMKLMPSMIASHNDEFEKSKGKLCSVDAPKVLEDNGWQSFLRDIKADPQE